MSISAKHQGFKRASIAYVASAFMAMLFSLCASGATVSFYMTNSIGQPDTNSIKLFATSAYVRADGTIQTIGLPIVLYPNTNGYVATNLMAGNWLATNRFIVSNFAIPGGVGSSQGILFAVPNSTNTYTFGSLAIPGYNVFNYTPGVRTITGTNGFVVTPTNGQGDVLIDGNMFSPTAAMITNAIGFFPPSPAQVTNAITNIVIQTNNALVLLIAGKQPANTTLSNLATMGTTNFYLNSNPSNYVTATVTNDLASTNFAQAQTKSNLVAGSHITFATNGNAITISSSSSLSSALLTLAGITATNITFSTSTGGSNFAISASGTNILFNLPVASSTASGKLSISDYTNFNARVTVAQLLLTSNSLIGSITNSGLAITNAITNQGVAVTNWVSNNFEPSITAGTTNQFWRGDKSFQDYSVITNPITAFIGVQFTNANLSLLSTSNSLRILIDTNAANIVINSNNLRSATNAMNIVAATNAANIVIVSNAVNAITPGESNTISSSANNGFPVIAVPSKVGVDLRLRTLVAGSGIGISTNASNVTFTVTGGVTATNAVLSINGLTQTNQFLDTGTAGTDFNISQNGSSTNVFNLPIASATTTGKVTAIDWLSFNNKVGTNFVTGLITTLSNQMNAQDLLLTNLVKTFGTNNTNFTLTASNSLYDAKQPTNANLTQFALHPTNDFYPTVNPSNFVSQTIWATNNPSNIVVTLPSVAFWTNGAEWRCSSGSNWFLTIAP